VIIWTNDYTSHILWTRPGNRRKTRGTNISIK